MKMKRIIPLLAFLGVMLMGSTAFAYISRSQCVIGGITIGAPRSYVTSTYGAPDRVKEGSGRMAVTTLYYGDSVEITLLNDYVVGVSSTANNGWSTIAGVTVGMDASVLEDVYGKDYQKRNFKGKLYYDYYTSITGMCSLYFGVKNNKITSIGYFQDW